MTDAWDALPVAKVRQRPASRQNEREQAETRYRNTTGDTNPLAQPVILPGEEGYAGGGEYLPDAGVVVRGDAWDSLPVVNGSKLRAATDAQTRSDNTPEQLRALTQGVTFGYSDELDALGAGLETRIGNVARRLRGEEIPYTAAEAEAAVRATERGNQDQFAQSKPFQNFAFQTAGGGLSALATGGVGSGITGAAATGAIGGGLYGSGVGQGSFADRLPGAATGAVVGGVAGGALQGAGQVAAPYAARLSGIAGGITRPIREFAGRIAGNRVEPEVTAARRLTDQLRRRGLSQNQIDEEITRYRSAGLEPSVVDVGGQNLRATVRASASGEGPGRELATQYAEGVRASVGPRSIERARRLTPDNRDAVQMAGDLTTARRTEANGLYRDAYNQEITVPDVVLSALRGPEGGTAIQQARRIAVLERDDAAVSALDNLAVSDLDQSPTATGKALDYVRQAYADMARDAEGNLGAALQGRVNEIEDGLNLIPELRTARTAYRSASEQIDAVGGVPDRLGGQRLGRPERAPRNAITTDPTRYDAYVNGLSPEAQAANQVYQRDQIVRTLGNAREGAVGPLNALSAGSNLPAGPNAPVVARNLEATFPGQGQQFQQDLRLAREQVTGANFIDPNTGSPTAGRIQDAAVEGAQTIANVATGGKTAVIRAGIDNIIRRAGLTEAEREAIVQLGIGSADDIQRIVALADASRASGRPPPREVRAWVLNANSTLGAQHPVAIELQQLLLPSRAIANEQEGQGQR